jgi:thymidylate synthase (FAD)
LSIYETLVERHYDNSDKLVAVEVGSIGRIEIIDACGGDTSIVNKARVSYNKQVTELSDKDEKLIRYLLKNKHFSPFEGNLLSFRVICPKPIAVQWMRHRSWVFSEASLRYTEQDDKFYTPDIYRKQAEVNKQASQETIWDTTTQAEITNTYTKAYEDGYRHYQHLLSLGIAREQARMVIPFGFMTTFIGSCNLRSFLHWYDLRDHEHAQFEIQMLAKAAYELVQRHFPLTMSIHRELRADTQSIYLQ